MIKFASSRFSVLFSCIQKATAAINAVTVVRIVDSVETFQTDENDEESVYVGNNRQKNNERMFVKIIRKEWT